MTRTTVLLLLLLAIAASAQIDPRIGTPVALQAVPWLAAAPVLDGNLDEAAWKAVTPTTDFYKFGYTMEQQGSFPPPADLKTALRAGVTKEGLWLAIECYEPDMAKLKATLVARDAGGLWTEDSIELYFATSPKTMGFKKYIINALGTQGDEINRDGIVDHAWNDDTWHVKTARFADHWTTEYFFPWASIGGPRGPGDLLPLGITRFSWGTGNIVGACWGAAMSNPYIYRSGMLLIEDNLAVTLTTIAGIEDRWRGATWHLWAGDRLVTVSTLAAETTRTLGEVEEVLEDLRFELMALPASKTRDAYANRQAEILRDHHAILGRGQDHWTRPDWLRANTLLLQARALRAEVRRDLMIQEAEKKQ